MTVAGRLQHDRSRTRLEDVEGPQLKDSATHSEAGKEGLDAHHGAVSRDAHVILARPPAANRDAAGDGDRWTDRLLDAAVSPVAAAIVLRTQMPKILDAANNLAANAIDGSAKAAAKPVVAGAVAVSIAREALVEQIRDPLAKHILDPTSAATENIVTAVARIAAVPVVHVINFGVNFRELIVQPTIDSIKRHRRDVERGLDRANQAGADLLDQTLEHTARPAIQFGTAAAGAEATVRAAVEPSLDRGSRLTANGVHGLSKAVMEPAVQVAGVVMNLNEAVIEPVRKPIDRVVASVNRELANGIHHGTQRVGGPVVRTSAALMGVRDTVTQLAGRIKPVVQAVAVRLSRTVKRVSQEISKRVTPVARALLAAGERVRKKISALLSGPP